MPRPFRVLAVLPILALAACTVHPPTGPSVMALPSQGKSLETFQGEDLMCRGYAEQQIGGTDPAQAGQRSMVGSAAVGTGLGAGVGMALGSLSGAMGAGAALGGAAGLLMGSTMGANNARAASGSLQQRYDIAYAQCMYSRGNAVQSMPTSQAYPYHYHGGSAVVFGGPWGGPMYRY